jgi:mRNA interferase RelE/StbE
LKVLWTPLAKESLARIGDREKQRTIFKRANALAVDPEKLGEPLRSQFTGLRKLRVSRFRIIYRIRKSDVEILLVGLRKKGDHADIYELAEKLLKNYLR